MAETWYLANTHKISSMIEISEMKITRVSGWATIKIIFSGTSLWLRICLPMQGTRVRSLVQEDPTCCRAPKPMCHNYWACALQPASPRTLGPTWHNYWSPRAYSLCTATKEATATRSLCTATKSSPRSLQLEKSPRAATKTQRSQKKNCIFKGI